MPLEVGSSKATQKRNFEEFGAGRTYARTERKFGKRKADKQRIAVVLNEARKSKKRHHSSHKAHRVHHRKTQRKTHHRSR